MKSTHTGHSSLFLWATHTQCQHQPWHLHSHNFASRSLSSVISSNLLQSCNLLCLLVFKGPFLLPIHCSTLSLSDFPPEGSGWRRHPADSTRQEPGPEGRSSKGLHWRRAVCYAAWTLHCLSGVSIIITYGLLLFTTRRMWDFSLCVCITLFDYHCLIRLSLTSSTLSNDTVLKNTNIHLPDEWLVGKR